jgi:hypothetical protein
MGVGRLIGGGPLVIGRRQRRDADAYEKTEPNPTACQPLRGRVSHACFSPLDSEERSDATGLNLNQKDEAGV